MHFRLWTLMRVGRQTHRLVRIIEANGGKYQPSRRKEPDWNELVGYSKHSNKQDLRPYAKGKRK